MDITIVTSAETNEEARALLKNLVYHFKKNKTIMAKGINES